MASPQGDDDMNFKTVNGSVAIYVPARFDANFRFDTVHGGIDSDFPMTLSGKWGPRHASGTIGNGGRDVRASSVNGSIELREKKISDPAGKKKGAKSLPSFLLHLGKVKSALRVARSRAGSSQRVFEPEAT